MSKYCSLGFSLHNYAHFTLYDITVYISFPEGLEIQTEPLDDPPEDPKAPPRPKEIALLFNQFTYVPVFLATPIKTDGAKPYLKFSRGITFDPRKKYFKHVSTNHLRPPLGTSGVILLTKFKYHKSMGF